MQSGMVRIGNFMDDEGDQLSRRIWKTPSPLKKKEDGGKLLLLLIGITYVYPPQESLPIVSIFSNTWGSDFAHLEPRCELCVIALEHALCCPPVS